MNLLIRNIFFLMTGLIPKNLIIISYTFQLHRVAVSKQLDLIILPNFTVFRFSTKIIYLDGFQSTLQAIFAGKGT